MFALRELTWWTPVRGRGTVIGRNVVDRSPRVAQSPAFPQPHLGRTHASARQYTRVRAGGSGCGSLRAEGKAGGGRGQHCGGSGGGHAGGPDRAAGGDGSRGGL